MASSKPAVAGGASAPVIAIDRSRGLSLDHNILLGRSDDAHKDLSVFTREALGEIHEGVKASNKATAQATLSARRASERDAESHTETISMRRTDGLHHDIISIAKSLSASADVVDAQRCGSNGSGVAGVSLAALSLSSLSQSGGKAPPALRIVHMSDTHSRLAKLSSSKKRPSSLYLPQGHVLIHSGNFSLTGSPEEFLQFNVWLGSVAEVYPVRIVVLGSKDVKQIGTQWTKAKAMLSHATYVLCHEGCEVLGLKIWGAPWCWAVKSNGLPRPGAPTTSTRYEEIPAGLDVLITASAGHDRLDGIAGGREHWGSRELAERIRKVQPLVHLHGHIKEGRGFVAAFNKAPLTLNSCMSTTDKADGVLYAAPHCIVAERVGHEGEGESFYHFHMGALED